MSIFRHTVKPAQVELSELLQAIVEECRKITEMDRKRVTFVATGEPFTPLRK